MSGELITTENKKPSIFDVGSLEKGGVVARQGFDFQDHVAVRFCLEMLGSVITTAEGDDASDSANGGGDGDAVLVEVWCEDQDDITLIWNNNSSQATVHQADDLTNTPSGSPRLTVEFVQVKNSHPDEYWNLSGLTKAETGGKSLIEKMLLNDRVVEPCQFRLVTTAPVNSKLQVLGESRDSPKRKNSSKLLSIKTELKTKLPEVVSKNQHTTDFWVENVLWEVLPGNIHIRTQNLQTLRELSETGFDFHLRNQEADYLYEQLLTKVKKAASAPQEVNGRPNLDKRLKRARLLKWLKSSIDTLKRQRARTDGVQVEPGLELLLETFARQSYDADKFVGQEAGEDEGSRIALDDIFVDLNIKLSKNSPSNTLSTSAGVSSNSKTVFYHTVNGLLLPASGKGSLKALELFCNPSLTSTGKAKVLLLGGPGQGKSTIGQQVAQFYRTTWFNPFSSAFEEDTLDDEHDDAATGGTETEADGRTDNQTETEIRDVPATRAEDAPEVASIEKQQSSGMGTPSVVTAPEKIIGRLNPSRINRTTVVFRVVLRDYAQWLALKSYVSFFPSSPSSNQYQSQQLTNALATYLAEKLPEGFVGSLSSETIYTIVKNYPCLLILDGVDEVTNPQLQTTTLASVNHFLVHTDKLQENLFTLILSRPFDTNRTNSISDLLSTNDFVKLELEPLIPEQVKEYAQKWRRFHKLSLENDRRVQQIFEEAVVNRQIAPLLVTPLQVAIMLRIIKEGGIPPKQREHLFFEYWNTILRREKNKGSQANKIITDDNQLFKLHCYLGYLIPNRAAGSRVEARLSEAEFREYVIHFLRKVDNVTRPDLLEKKVENLIHETGDRIVLLTSPEQGFFAFELRSFQEFFAASYFIQQGSTPSKIFNQLQAIAVHQHWRNVLILALAKLARERDNITELRYIVMGLCESLNKISNFGVLLKTDGFVKNITNPLGSGSVLALELVADNIAGSMRDLQKELLEYGLKVLDSPVAAATQSRLLTFLRAVSFEDREEIVRPVLEEKVNSISSSILMDILSIYQELFLEKETYLPYEVSRVSPLLEDDANDANPGSISDTSFQVTRQEDFDKEDDDKKQEHANKRVVSLLQQKLEVLLQLGTLRDVREVFDIAVELQLPVEWLAHHLSEYVSSWQTQLLDWWTKDAIDDYYYYHLEDPSDYLVRLFKKWSPDVSTVHQLMERNFTLSIIESGADSFGFDGHQGRYKQPELLPIIAARKNTLSPADYLVAFLQCIRLVRLYPLGDNQEAQTLFDFGGKLSLERSHRTVSPGQSGLRQALNTEHIQELLTEKYTKDFPQLTALLWILYWNIAEPDTGYLTYYFDFLKSLRLSGTLNEKYLNFFVATFKELLRNLVREWPLMTFSIETVIGWNRNNGGILTGIFSDDTVSSDSTPNGSNTTTLLATSTRHNIKDSNNKTFRHERLEQLIKEILTSSSQERLRDSIDEALTDFSQLAKKFQNQQSENEDDVVRQPDIAVGEELANNSKKQKLQSQSVIEDDKEQKEQAKLQEFLYYLVLVIHEKQNLSQYRVENYFRQTFPQLQLVADVLDVPTSELILAFFHEEFTNDSSPSSALKHEMLFELLKPESSLASLAVSKKFFLTLFVQLAYQTELPSVLVARFVSLTEEYLGKLAQINLNPRLSASEEQEAAAGKTINDATITLALRAYLACLFFLWKSDEQVDNNEPSTNSNNTLSSLSAIENDNQVEHLLRLLLKMLGRVSEAYNLNNAVFYTSILYIYRLKPLIEKYMLDEDEQVSQGAFVLWYVLSWQYTPEQYVQWLQQQKASWAREQNISVDSEEIRLRYGQFEDQHPTSLIFYAPQIVTRAWKYITMGKSLLRKAGLLTLAYHQNQVDWNELVVLIDKAQSRRTAREATRSDYREISTWYSFLEKTAIIFPGRRNKVLNILLRILFNHQKYSKTSLYLAISTFERLLPATSAELASEQERKLGLSY